jgi:hypothetical protein
LGKYRSIALWQSAAKPLWVYWIPALIWAVAWLGLKWRARRALLKEVATASSRGGIALRWLAVVLAALTLAQSGLHWIPPRLGASETILAIARGFLVQRKMMADFDHLAAKPVWKGQRLKVLLEHVALANYNRALVNWKLDDEVYREFVLSPIIRPDAHEELNWRRPLWESFYPRIRKEQSLEAAAEIVVRHLRERVTIAGSESFPAGVESIWKRQITHPLGFEGIYVAALRSAGIPARLNLQGQVEYWTGTAWRSAPPPPLQRFP